jgi:hypothetical protein
MPSQNNDITSVRLVKFRKNEIILDGKKKLLITIRDHSDKMIFKKMYLR